MRNRNPPSAARAHTAVTVAPANGALRKKRRSIRGSAWRSSYGTRQASASAATAKQASVRGEPQPAAGASMNPYVTVASTTMISTWPTGSIRRARGARDSGTNSAHSTNAATPTGMLIQKIACQPAVPTSVPPTSGPSAMLRPIMPPHTPMALARSRGSVKVFVMIDMATGLSMEPPTACSARAATSQPRLGASEHMSEPSVNSVSPVWNVRRRPTRSPVEPDSMSRLASTSVYASMIH